MKREFLEETGLEIEIEIEIEENIGVIDIKLSWLWRDFTVSEKDVSLENASPLVLKAFEWLRTNNLSIDANIYEDWKDLK